MRSTPWSRATSIAPARPRRMPTPRWRAATTCRRCTACRSASRTCRKPPGLRTTFGSTIFRDNVPAADERLVAAVRQAGAIVIGKTNTPEFGAGANTRNAVYGATGNPFDPARSCAGSSGGSAVALATGMAPICSGSDTGGSLRNPAVVLRHRRLPPDARPGRQRTARPRLEQPVRRGPDGAHRARPVPAALHHGQRRCARSAGDHRAWPHHPPPRGLRHAGAHRSVAPARGVHAGLRLRAHRAAHRRGVRREDRPVPPCLRRRPKTPRPDCAGADEAFEVLRALGFLASHAEKVRTRPQDVGPNVRANVEEGLRYTAADVARAQTLQTTLYRRWQTFFQDWDVILTPSITISPRSWRELYPGGDRRQADAHLLPLARAGLCGDAARPSRRVPAGRPRSAWHAVRPADRRAARRRCASCCPLPPNWKRCWPAMLAPRAQFRISQP